MGMVISTWKALRCAIIDFHDHFHFHIKGIKNQNPQNQEDIIQEVPHLFKQLGPLVDYHASFRAMQLHSSNSIVSNVRSRSKFLPQSPTIQVYPPFLVTITTQ
jgi:hypothetical protein